MRSTLEDLFYGNIVPNERQITANSELQRMIKRAAECERELAELLHEKDRHALTALTSAQQEINSITAIENFITGFRLGVRLIMECMDKDDGDIQEMR